MFQIHWTYRFVRVYNVLAALQRNTGVFWRALYTVETLIKWYIVLSHQGETAEGEEERKIGRGM